MLWSGQPQVLEVIQPMLHSLEEEDATKATRNQRKASRIHHRKLSPSHNCRWSASADFDPSDSADYLYSRGRFYFRGSSSGRFGMYNPTDWVYPLTQYIQNIQILPALLQTAVLALLSSSIPLSMIVTSTLIAIDAFGKLTIDPSVKEVHLASSIHVVAYSSQGDLLVIESEGSFSTDILEQVVETASQVCRGQSSEGSKNVDVHMEEGAMSLEDSMKMLVQTKIAKEQKWKENLGQVWGRGRDLNLNPTPSSQDELFETAAGIRFRGRAINGCRNQDWYQQSESGRRAKGKIVEQKMGWLFASCLIRSIQIWSCDGGLDFGISQRNFSLLWMCLGSAHAVHCHVNGMSYCGSA